MKQSALLQFCLLCVVGSAPLKAGGLPLQAKHAAAATSCFNCHQEENPAKGAKVANASCMACHGDFAELAFQTKGLPANPHSQRPAPHPGPSDCTECHKQHQPPVVKCLECHPKFKFNVK